MREAWDRAWAARARRGGREDEGEDEEEEEEEEETEGEEEEGADKPEDAEDAIPCARFWAAPMRGREDGCCLICELAFCWVGARGCAKCAPKAKQDGGEKAPH
jgi:hypothetical protein